MQKVVGFNYQISTLNISEQSWVGCSHRFIVTIHIHSPCVRALGRFQHHGQFSRHIQREITNAVSCLVEQRNSKPFITIGDENTIFIL